MPDTEIIFETHESPEGGYEARARGYSIFSQADDCEQLKEALRDAVRCHFEEGESPGLIRIHLVRDEVIKV